MRRETIAGRNEAAETGPSQAVLIAGPTASGKSALALALAERIGGVVVNADSMQVYGDLRVLTARPSPQEEARAPHRLYGHIDGGEAYSVGRWLADARVVLAGIRAVGAMPIVTGGTGLYFKALVEGLSAIPPIPAPVRAAVRDQAQGRSTRALHADLAETDPVMAERLDPADRSRILRAIEVWAATGQSLADFRGRKQPGLLAGMPLKRLFLAPDRALLRTAIDVRFDSMMATGALEEAEALGRRGLDPTLPIMRAHGVPWLIAHIRGDMRLDEAALRAKADTQRYAKRQFTWFRHQAPEWEWAPGGATPSLMHALVRTCTGR